MRLADKRVLSRFTVCDTPRRRHSHTSTGCAYFKGCGLFQASKEQRTDKPLTLQPECHKCGAPMSDVSIKPHPTSALASLHTYACKCGHSYVVEVAPYPKQP